MGGVRSSQFLIVGEDTILPNFTNCFIKLHMQDGRNTVGPIPYPPESYHCFLIRNNSIVGTDVLGCPHISTNQNNTRESKF